MKIYTSEIYKRNFQFVLFLILSAFFVGICFLNLKTLRVANNPVLIGIDANGARIISENTDPILRTEALSFVQQFITNLYNFDSSNYLKRLGLVSMLMSEGLWQKKSSEFIDLRSRIERDSVQLSSEIQKITLDDKGVYHSLLEVKEKSRLSEVTHKVQISVKLQKVQRSVSNPSGMEVDFYEESPIRD